MKNNEDKALELALKVMKAKDDNLPSAFFGAVTGIIEDFLVEMQKPVLDSDKYVLIQDEEPGGDCTACCMYIDYKCRQYKYTDKLCTDGDREDDTLMYHWEENE